MHIHSPREHAWLKSAQPRIACSFLAALVTEHIDALSHLPRLSSSLALPYNLVTWNWIQKPCEIHGGVADPLKSASPTGYERN